MAVFELELYETEDGKEPVAEFLDSLDSKMNAKLIGLMELLEEKGTELLEPYSAPLGDGIFELRCKLGSNITRALYFFFLLVCPFIMTSYVCDMAIQSKRKRKVLF